MIKVALISRENLFTVPGGDTIQIQNTCHELELLGIKANIVLAGQKPAANEFDLFHFFNITRPFDILPFISKYKIPYVVTPIYVDYSEYDLLHRKGFGGLVLRMAGKNKSENIKHFARGIKGKQAAAGLTTLFSNHRRSMETILNDSSALLPGSLNEYKRLTADLAFKPGYKVVYNGIDHKFWGAFLQNNAEEKRSGVICVARIEGIKNQLNLINAANHQDYSLDIIGKPAPNQISYYKKCVSAAGENVSFIPQMSQSELASYYLKAKVHVLPSWFETTGLSSLEAAFMGCNIVVTGKGDTREYFENFAFYADPGNPESIRLAIEKAMAGPYDSAIREKILNSFTWEKAAKEIYDTYKEILG